MRKRLGPLFLMLACPPAAILFWHVNTELKGAFYPLWEAFVAKGFFMTLYQIWSPYFFGTQTAWALLFLFGSVQLLFMKLLPGKVFYGPLTPMGNTPVYKANGVASFCGTLLLFWISTFFFPATLLYDNLGGLLGALNFFSLLFCLLLYFKGRLAPSSSDHSLTGNFLFDYYWGTELYPRFFGWDVKLFTNCRMGMMGWGLLLLSYAAKQKELYGLSDGMLVSISLQFIYLTKFYFWETGYLRSLDIMHDRAGFYICWGCLVWVPCVYTSPALYLVHHPNHLGLGLSTLLFLIGASAILINFWADKQRQLFRLAKGECTIWGKKPLYTVAPYMTDRGEKSTNLLLASGWWGVARHFHYLPELIGTLCWSLPALFTHFSPYFYLCFLTVLLFDRAKRDELKCAQKYQQGWREHCEKVPYRIIPYIY